MISLKKVKFDPYFLLRISLTSLMLIINVKSQSTELKNSVNHNQTSPSAPVQESASSFRTTIGVYSEIEEYDLPSLNISYFKNIRTRYNYQPVRYIGFMQEYGASFGYTTRPRAVVFAFANIGIEGGWSDYFYMDAYFGFTLPYYILPYIGTRARFQYPLSESISLDISGTIYFPASRGILYQLNIGLFISNFL